ncbi:MAG: hypothetical protein WC479_11075 [Candidatus Izemoplasmatales bacterium]|jgi:hypothetical protein
MLESFFGGSAFLKNLLIGQNKNTKENNSNGMVKTQFSKGSRRNAIKMGIDCHIPRKIKRKNCFLLVFLFLTIKNKLTDDRIEHKGIIKHTQVSDKKISIPSTKTETTNPIIFFNFITPTG